MSFFDNLGERLATLGEDIVEWAILILIALVVLVIGRWLLRLVRTAIEKVLGAHTLNPIWQKSGVSKAMEESEQTPANLFASVAYAYLMVALWVIVARILNLDTIADLLVRLLAWVPLVLLAAVIVIIAASVANWTANLVQPFAAEKGVPWLTWLVRVGIILFGVLFALDLLEIDFAENIVEILVAAGGIALAIAFGVGGIDAAKRWWSHFGTPDKVIDNTNVVGNPPPRQNNPPDVM